VILQVLAGAMWLVGSLIAIFALRALGPSFRLLARSTTRIGEAKPGSIEVSGIIRARDKPTESARDKPSVLVHTREERQRNKSYEDYDRRSIVCRAVMEDGSGTCEIMLEHAIVVGETWESYRSDTRSRFTQTTIPEGARVVVSGRAVKGEAHPLRIEGTEDDPLTIAIGSDASVAWTLGWRAVIALVCGLALLGLGAVVWWLERNLGLS
jgi:hypothetical protein